MVRTLREIRSPMKIAAATLVLFALVLGVASAAFAEEPAPDLAARVADLEAYINNGAPSRSPASRARATTPG
jgi:hypothetical protein